MIEIKPVVITQFPETITATHCEVSSISVIPGKGASGSVVLGNESEPDADGNTHFVPATGSYTVAMTEPQYREWGTDDSYAIDCLLTNLGIERA